MGMVWVWFAAAAAIIKSVYTPLIMENVFLCLDVLVS